MDTQYYCSFQKDKNSRIKHLGPFSRNVAEKYTALYVSKGFMWAETQNAQQVYGE